MLKIGSWWESPSGVAVDGLSPHLGASFDKYRDLAAIVDPHRGTTLTYGDVQADALRLVHELVALGVTRGSSVAIACERSIEELVAVVACSLGGYCYSGLDQEAPRTHVLVTMGQFQPAMVLCRENEVQRLQPICLELGTRLHPVSLGREHRDGRVDGSASLKLSDDELLYVAYTSGTSGFPKGVNVRRDSVANLAAGAADYVIALAPGKRFLRLAPLAFDASTYEIFAPLFWGATLVVYPRGMVDVEELGAFLQENEIASAWLTASLFATLMSTRPSSVVHMTQIVSGGEVIPPAAAQEFFRHCPQGLLTNAYGPTETTTFAMQFTFDTEHEIGSRIPLGCPVPGVAIALDENFELLISGRGVAAGYAGEGGASTAKFSSLGGKRFYRTGDRVELIDEYAYFDGRLDGQVKVRGHRVETEYIEQLLSELSPNLEKAVVVTFADDGETARLGCALVGVESTPEFAREMRRNLSRKLREVLPGHAVPTKWITLSDPPLTRSGKLDRVAISQMFERKTE